MQVTHSEVKQTETSEFGAQKVLLQGHARRQVAHALEVWNSPEALKALKTQVREGTLTVCGQLVYKSLNS